MASKLLTRWNIRVQELRQSATAHPGKTALVILALVILAIPIVMLGTMLVRYSVNVPFWDQWIYISLVDKWQHGQLGFYDLWLQHNEHRIMVPKFFQLMMSSVTGWNIRFEIMMNFIFALTSFGLMLDILRRTFNKKWLPFLLVAPLIAFLFFSPMQYINWIWGFQLAWFLSITAVVAAIWALTVHTYKTIDRFFIFALVAAVVATYSMGNGMLVWIVGAGVLLLRGATKRHYMVWAVTGLLAIAGYFFKLQRSDEESPVSVLMHRTGDVFDYIYQYLGHNLAVTPQAARNTGITLIVLVLVSVVLLVRKKRLAGAAPWLAIAGYGFLTAVLAAVSRLPNFGVNHSMVYSYTTMSVLFVVGVVVTVGYTAFVYLQDAKAPALKGYLLVAFGLGVLAWPMVSGFRQNYITGAENLKGLSKHFTTVRHCIFTATSPEDDCLLKVYPDKDTAWQGIQTLKRLNWDNLGKQ